MSAIQQRFATLAPYVSKRGDWDAFLTLGTDNLAKIVILPAILIGTFHFPSQVVFGQIMPGLGLTLLVGLGIFAAMGARLAAKEGRQDVTCPGRIFSSVENCDQQPDLVVESWPAIQTRKAGHESFTVFLRTKGHELSLPVSQAAPSSVDEA